MPDLSLFLSLSSLSLLLRRGLMRSLSVFSVLLAFLQVDSSLINSSSVFSVLLAFLQVGSSLINSSSVFSVLLVFLQVLSKFPKILPEFLSNSPQEPSGALPRTSYTPRSLQVLSLRFLQVLSPLSILFSPRPSTFSPLRASVYPCETKSDGKDGRGQHPIPTESGCHVKRKTAIKELTTR